MLNENKREKLLEVLESLVGKWSRGLAASINCFEKFE